MSLRRYAFTFLAAFLTFGLWAQGYTFTDINRIEVSGVKNQASSGTCWSFATASFLEAELIRMGKGEYDLSEMFVVRYKYKKQLEDNYVRRGKGNIGQGSLSHTFTNIFSEYGIAPEEVYNGINYDSERHNHTEMVSFIKAVAGAAIDLKRRSKEYYKVVDGILDTYLGAPPASFTYKGVEYTPKSFADGLGLVMDDYIELTSFTHHPYYAEFDLEVPDNWEHKLMYNVPLDDLMSTIDHALAKGYTICWDGDVSDKGFSFVNGIAIQPDVKNTGIYATDDRARFEKLDESARLEEIYKFEQPYPEVTVTPQVRQEGYESFVTTDDHLMHITGSAKDQNGALYYITKNSWGAERNAMNGYLNMSESYVRAKTIYIMLHKDAIPRAVKTKLGI
ncbi:MAG: C1 family peptidase [Tannerellaceae bacterium]|nr:C1 family peptidase [Tannerellaceae bacterium]